MRSTLAAVVAQPRSAMERVVARPAWLGPWLTIAVVVCLSGGWLLSTPVGRQAVVDEQVRVVEAFGGTVTDAAYTAWQADPPWQVYLTSGGRLPLLPPVTLAVATLLWLMARGHAPQRRFVEALAVAVHATVVLAIGQLIATPLHYGRESLTSPLTVARLVGVEEGTGAAMVLGAMDLFTLWWLALLAIGAGALARRPTRRFAIGAVAAYATVAAVIAAVQTWSGGR